MKQSILYSIYGQSVITILSCVIWIHVTSKCISNYRQTRRESLFIYNLPLFSFLQSPFTWLPYLWVKMDKGMSMSFPKTEWEKKMTAGGGGGYDEIYEAYLKFVYSTETKIGQSCSNKYSESEHTQSMDITYVTYAYKCVYSCNYMSQCEYLYNKCVRVYVRQWNDVIIKSINRPLPIIVSIKTENSVILLHCHASAWLF